MISNVLSQCFEFLKLQIFISVYKISILKTVQISNYLPYILSLRYTYILIWNYRTHDVSRFQVLFSLKNSTKDYIVKTPKNILLIFQDYRRHSNGYELCSLSTCFGIFSLHFNSFTFELYHASHVFPCK